MAPLRLVSSRLQQSATQAGSKAVDEVSICESLFRDYNALLVKLLTARLGSVDIAHEIAQEAYIRLMLARGRTASIKNHKAYLFQIAQNLATDHIRHECTVKAHAAQNPVDEADEVADPARSTSALQSFDCLERSIAELPEKTRQAFELHRCQGLALGEIAEKMGLTERMVRNHIARALVHCQTRLDEMNGVER
jgi:RNA polymerase sigma-70 factor (ECF subfamily)